MDEETQEIRASVQKILGLSEYYEKAAATPQESIEDADATKRELASTKKEILRYTFEIRKALKKAEKKIAQNA